MAKPYFQVHVPIRSTVQPERHGIHVLTGPADTAPQAVRIAREACDAALAARAAGLGVPHRRLDGWGARGVRPGWVPDWAAATVVRWDLCAFRTPYHASLRPRSDRPATR
ncbi:hypothetical protein [Streptomyces sp. NPDC018031]|uniref:hypothetical protein n=1 Tax=Streptomyces sp. NPDC018031 TaxID=3365033 RepID=UPI0037B8C080